MGASVKRGVGKSRPDVGDSLFSEIVMVLTSECEMLIPDYLADVYLTYSMGSWQRSREFHLKVHLTTAAFLALTDRLCQQYSLGSNPLHGFKKELEKREKSHHRGEKLRELFKMPEGSMVDLHAESNYHIATVSELDYPLLCLYQAEHGKPGVNTAISATQLPDALKVLEEFMSRSRIWGQKGYSVGMIMSPSGSESGTMQCVASGAKLPLSFQIAAVVDEKEFAGYTGKDEAMVKKSWAWAEPERKYYKGHAK